jgi:hypothetical protein
MMMENKNSSPVMIFLYDESGSFQSGPDYLDETDVKYIRFDIVRSVVTKVARFGNASVFDDNEIHLLQDIFVEHAKHIEHLEKWKKKMNKIADEHTLGLA